MPTELQIIRAQEFIRLGAQGRIDLEASKVVLAQLAEACWKRGIHQALLDIRSLQVGPTPVFSPADLIALVGTFREIGFTHRDRLAVLYRSDPHLRARMFAALAVIRGWCVQAFDDFEQALTWLSGAAPEPAEAKAGAVKAQKVPVRKGKISKPASRTKPKARTDTRSDAGSRPSMEWRTPNDRR